jgi:D-alanyl-D-alanine carboxypeptidase
MSTMTRSNHHRNPTERRSKLVLSGVIGASLTAAALIATSAMAKPTNAAARQASPLQKGVDGLVAAGAPGAILFIRDGNHTTRLTGGFADLRRKSPMRGNEHFKIASLTKTYTATVALQLVQEGKLRLKDNVERWLPKLVPNGRQITVHMLLNHTSGLADFDSDPRYLKPYLEGNLAYEWPQRDLVRIAVSHKPLFPPGKAPHEVYSNTDYVLLGLIIEKAAKRSLGAELQRRIFSPLHLTDTVFPTKPGLKKPYAHGYMVLGKPPAIDVTGLSPSLSFASGAIVATARDTADFYRGLLTGRLLKPDVLKAMKTTISGGPHVDIPGQRYGYGIETFPTQCGIAWGHNGVIPGYWTFIYSSSDGRRQALLTVNHDAQSLPRAKVMGPLFHKLIANAYCSTA